MPIKRIKILHLLLRPSVYVNVNMYTIPPYVILYYYYNVKFVIILFWHCHNIVCECEIQFYYRIDVLDN